MHLRSLTLFGNSVEWKVEPDTSLSADLKINGYSFLVTVLTESAPYEWNVWRGGVYDFPEREGTGATIESAQRAAFSYLATLDESISLAHSSKEQVVFLMGDVVDAEYAEYIERELFFASDSDPNSPEGKDRIILTSVLTGAAYSIRTSNFNRFNFKPCYFGDLASYRGKVAKDHQYALDRLNYKKQKADANLNRADLLISESYPQA